MVSNRGPGPQEAVINLHIDSWSPNQIFADGEIPVVLLHGLFGMGSNLGALARCLRDLAPVFTVDLPNHGRSDWMSSMALSDLARCIRNSLEPVAGRGAYLVGHSLGGKVAMQMALMDPVWVRALVVADIAPVDYEPRHAAVFNALRAVEQERPTTRKAAREMLHAALDEPGVADFLALSLESTATGVRWRFNLDVLESKYAEILRAPVAQKPYSSATLFLKGERSPYILPEHLSTIRHWFPQARVHQLAGTGHWLHAEKPERFNQIVRDFLCSQGLGALSVALRQSS